MVNAGIIQPWQATGGHDVTNRQPATFDSEGKPEKAAPPIRLASLEEIRREMASVYRDMRRGKVETQDGTRLVYVLGELVKVAKAEVELAKNEPQAALESKSITVMFEALRELDNTLER